MHAVLLNSGGIDSRVTAKLARDQGYVLHSLHIAANKQIAPASLPAAAKTAELYCADHFVFEYPVDWGKLKFKQGHKFSGVGYNALMVATIGAQYAFFKGFELIVSGTKRERRSADFHTRFEAIVNESLHTTPVKFVSPIYEMMFKDVIKLARENKVPLEDTYSCTFYPQCGACPTCVQRRIFGLL